MTIEGEFYVEESISLPENTAEPLELDWTP